MKYVCHDATKRDIEIITSIRLITMVDSVMEKKLSYEEKSKLKDKIAKDIKDNYDKYKVIYVDNKKAGIYLVVPYLKGIMIDIIYLFEEYRNSGIGTDIINNIKKEYDFTYIWLYQNNELFIKLLKKLGFDEYEKNNRIIILRSMDFADRLLDSMKDFKIGYSDRKGNYYRVLDDSFLDNYYLQKPLDAINSKIGLSFDQVEVERYYLNKMDVSFRTYYLLYQDSELGPAHSFLLYRDNKKYYWLENAWYKYRGVHEYNSKEEAFIDISRKFSKTIKNFKKEKLKLFEFDKPRYGTSYERYKNNAITGHIIRLTRG